MNPPLLDLDAALEKVKLRVTYEIVKEFLKLPYCVGMEVEKVTELPLVLGDAAESMEKTTRALKVLKIVESVNIQILIASTKEIDEKVLNKDNL
ncbi:hypothetical protein SUGI_0072980 [Cryptomeria japonica]|nr:hypothetical protein SUGI_0072980 [Cryptomeria japonica]